METESVNTAKMEAGAVNNEKTSRKIWNFFDNFKGDKVLWMIVMFLMIISLITIFASASGLADDAKEITRLNIFFSQFKLACAGMLFIILIYNFRNLTLIKFGSKWGFMLSLALLTCLITGFKAITVNGATRALEIFGMQIYIFEVIKVAMVMYLAWVIEAYKEGREFTLTRIMMAVSPKMAFLQKPIWQRVVYIYAPVIITAAGMLKGGISSTLFTSLLMFVVLFLGGMPKREIFGALFAGICILGAAAGLHFATEGKFIPRIGVAVDRMTLSQQYRIIEEENKIAAIEELRGEKHIWSDEYKHAIDRIRQPESAKLAIKEGGILGKGPGNSTQKYSVYAIYSDYIFSFLIEEFGLAGGIFTMILYLSIMARGCMIVRFCDTVFAKIAVAGLCVLITGQAFMHILVNVNIGPLTGQTLPLVSHGSSSFLCFSVAFGVLLSISRLARKKVDAQIAEVQARCPDAQDNDDVDKDSSRTWDASGDGRTWHSGDDARYSDDDREENGEEDESGEEEDGYEEDDEYEDGYEEDDEYEEEDERKTER